jgi:DNA helicase INO80
MENNTANGTQASGDTGPNEHSTVSSSISSAKTPLIPSILTAFLPQRISISAILSSPSPEVDSAPLIKPPSKVNTVKNTTTTTGATAATNPVVNEAANNTFDEVNLPHNFTELLAEANQIKYRNEKEAYLHRLKSKLAHITTLDILSMKSENWDYINQEEFDFLDKASHDNLEVKKLLKQLSSAELIKKEPKKKPSKGSKAKLKTDESNDKVTTGGNNSRKRRNSDETEPASKAIKPKMAKAQAAPKDSKGFLQIAPAPNSDVATEADGKKKKVTNLRQRAARANAEKQIENQLQESVEDNASQEPEPETANKTQSKFSAKELKAIQRQYDNTYFTIWKDLSRKDASKVHRLLQQAIQTRQVNARKTAVLCSREAKKWQLRTNKGQKDLQAKARRSMREMFSFWKRNEREERDLRKKVEKEAVEQAKREEEQRESRRQARKLNFLITQTELYSHFIGKKIKTDEIEGNQTPGHTNGKHDHIEAPIGATKTDVEAIDFDSDNEEEIQKAAAANAQSALLEAKERARQFDSHGKEQQPNGELKQINIDDDDLNFQNPTSLGDISIEQPKLLNCTLKEYQVKGLNWLANLYDQGINGILADEMGLGKTVQSISVLAYLAESHNIWGPYLVVSPASTLHNWQQEISKFVPDFKVLPYWGNSKDRKVLRKFWDRKNVSYTKNSPFHVLVTSYQLIVQDIQYFQRIKWQYMILDEAQAIKSSQSSRWKSLLGLQCRNRLLLTGTPIQNSMQELWALLHFIMPTLFDSHDEFSDWFAKDIESHAQSNTQLNQQQLRRLHVILKPFMLRRIKKNVQSELGDKIEIDVYCDLTTRQQKLYKMLKSQISLLDLMEKVRSGSDDSNQSLINLVMQFRKVCNHPDLFERDDVKSPFAFAKFAETGSFARETNELEYSYSSKSQLEFELPKLIYRELLCPNEDNQVDMKDHTLNNRFNIWNAKHITENSQGSDSFTWLKFVDKTANEVASISRGNIIQRAIDLRTYTNNIDDGNDEDKHRGFLLINRPKPEPYLRKIQETVYTDLYLNVHDSSVIPPASAPPIEISCPDAAFVNDKKNELFNPRIRQALTDLSLNTQLDLIEKHVPVSKFPKAEMLPEPLNNKAGYSSIKMPSMNRFISNSAKLAKLDQLLVELQRDDHRVLIYFQMTKMMDLMEEYLTYRQYKYIRLDGSSKLDDRRDLVSDWQTRPDLFVFLLSTRAGGLGINLTAADTVIFYDSDWNPTIDSQAMDRAHRLGQTRQVTVYRLLARGTIEERMRDRAKQKEHVQQVVMEGKTSTEQDEEAVGFQKGPNVALWLLDDDQAAEAMKNKQLEDERKANKKKAVIQRKKNKNVNLEDMYHEGEGNFDDGTNTGLPSRAITPAIK